MRVSDATTTTLIASRTPHWLLEVQAMQKTAISSRVHRLAADQALAQSHGPALNTLSSESCDHHATHQSRKGQLPQQEIRRLLVLPDFLESFRARSVSMWFPRCSLTRLSSSTRDRFIACPLFLRRWLLLDFLLLPSSLLLSCIRCGVLLVVVVLLFRFFCSPPRDCSSIGSYRDSGSVCCPGL